MDGLRRDVHALARFHLARDTVVALLNLEEQAPRVKVDGLVLDVVVLQAQRVPRVDVDELPRVPVRLRPVKLVSPRLVDSCGHLPLPIVMSCPTDRSNSTADTTLP